MRDKITIEDSVEWYSSKRHIYKKLALKVHHIVQELLDLNNISIHAIFNRIKEIESFKEKIKDPKYTDPEKQITDLAGVRIICYVESDIAKICEVIENNFDIDKPNSVDKSALLGTDKVGYKSVHYVAKLNKTRLQLPEYKNFEKSKFEIQIRTILQHAWAEIEHDRNYKFSGELPSEIQRRFKLVAGSLELADREFDRIASDIDNIILEVEKGTKSGEIDFEINTTTLKQFLSTKFEYFVPKIIDPSFPNSNSELRILDELREFGLKNLNDLNKSIPEDFIENLKKSSNVSSNFMGLLRMIMISSDWKKYFDNAYDNVWSISSLKKRGILDKYNVPISEIIQKYNTPQTRLSRSRTQKNSKPK
jgi:ppGpp synthetase/RelA/SpoT-type nucleotidyltranferase